jgi:hypothetical protein
MFGQQARGGLAARPEGAAGAVASVPLSGRRGGCFAHFAAQRAALFAPFGQ